MSKLNYYNFLSFTVAIKSIGNCAFIRVTHATNQGVELRILSLAALGAL